ncbi:MAG: Peroxyureidoacrylate/ureidoacrylate amidohydrolase RutB [Nitrospira sp.]|nr:Peroxyureidoacrylate/ureidoacrylate amidohydrolase RutB [Nitrospira sp.]
MIQESKIKSVGEFRAVVPSLAPFIAGETALIVVDMTNFDAHPDHGFARVVAGHGADLSHYWEKVEKFALPNSMRLVDAFRLSGGRIVFTRVGGQFNDYADSLVHLRALHRQSGSQRGTVEFDMRAEFEPRRGEIVVDKPGSSAFTTGNLDILLRNAGVKHLVFCGVVTNACVLLSALTAWDLGYAVRIVEDACAADSDEAQNAGLMVARWLGCEIVMTDAVIADIASSQE